MVKISPFWTGKLCAIILFTLWMTRDTFVSMNVPTPDEIRARMDLQERGFAPQAMSMSAQETEISELRRQLGELQSKMSRPKSSAEIREGLMLICQKYSMIPAEELIKMAMETRELPDGTKVWALTPELRTKILTEILGYQMPKLKAVEVQGQIDHEHHIMIVRYGEDGGIRKEPRQLNTMLAVPNVRQAPIELPGEVR